MNRWVALFTMLIVGIIYGHKTFAQMIISPAEGNFSGNGCVPFIEISQPADKKQNTIAASENVANFSLAELGAADKWKFNGCPGPYSDAVLPTKAPLREDTMHGQGLSRCFEKIGTTSYNGSCGVSEVVYREFSGNKCIRDKDVRSFLALRAANLNTVNFQSRTMRSCKFIKRELHGLLGKLSANSRLPSQSLHSGSGSSSFGDGLCNLFRLCFTRFLGIFAQLDRDAVQAIGGDRKPESNASQRNSSPPYQLFKKRLVVFILLLLGGFWLSGRGAVNINYKRLGVGAGQTVVGAALAFGGLGLLLLNAFRWSWGWWL